MSKTADIATILLVDDDIEFRGSVEIVLKKNNYVVLTADGVESACDILKKHRIDLVISDLKMADGSGLDLLARTKSQSPEITIIIQTAFGSIENAVTAMRHGAYDYISKPFRNEELLITVEKALEHKNIKEELSALREQIAWNYGFDSLIGISDAMRHLKNMASRVATTDIVILISGESGTGKELLAKAIHYHSGRRRKRFIPIECTSIPENLLESELFGHVRGSFTSAHADRKGLFEEGGGGTIFLDEVGDMPMTLQAKILRVLQESEIRPVGSSISKKIDVRVIAATNRDLADMVEKGTFREDLFYRLNVLPLNIPPLRQRIDDIPVLVEHFLKRESTEQKDGFAITTKAMEKLLSHTWPGNVRELENTLKRAMALSQTREINDRDIVFITSSKMHPPIILRRESIAETGTLEESLKHRIETMLHANDWNLTRTAARLGIGRTTLWRKIKKYNIAKAGEYADVEQE
ncbi:MAG: sigma-54 dependent transcriptional regulator [Candidatus Zixiibacteriota bacterium]